MSKIEGTRRGKDGDVRFDFKSAALGAILGGLLVVGYMRYDQNQHCWMQTLPDLSQVQVCPAGQGGAPSR